MILPIKLIVSAIVLPALLLGLQNESYAQKTTSEVLEASTAKDWRTPEPANLLLMQLDSGSLLIELAPQFAPQHVNNVRKLVTQKYFDGLAIIRSQDNYVVQWGDPAAESDSPKSMGDAKSTLAGEFFRELKGLKIAAVESNDAYAEKVGFVDGFPVGADAGRAWLSHCYGMLGAGRAGPADSGNGAELYVVTGHAPRHLDRNVTLLGRVLTGMPHLSSLPRGTGPLGFFEDEDQYVQIQSIRLGTEVIKELPNIEVMRTDTKTFNDFVLSRTVRNEDWFLDPTGKIELCNINVPVRTRK